MLIFCVVECTLLEFVEFGLESGGGVVEDEGVVETGVGVVKGGHRFELGGFSCKGFDT